MDSKPQLTIKDKNGTEITISAESEDLVIKLFRKIMNTLNKEGGNGKTKQNE